jgi:DNA-binding transcriptional LysR family regulator
MLRISDLLKYIRMTKLQERSFMEWNDLRLVLAVAENGGILGGAKALSVHPTTVSRRLKSIEAGHRARLFDKFKHGVALTEAGADVVETARRMRALTHELDARLDGRDTTLRGVIRFTAVGTLLRRWMPDFAAFQARYPQIELELTPGLNMANLTHREADVAARIAESAPDHLIGVRLCPVAHAVYASADLIERMGADTPLDQWPWVAYDLAVFRGVDAYLAAFHPGARVVMRVPEIDLLAQALIGGVGVGVLQCAVGDARPELRRVGGFQPGGSHALWVLTHPHLRGTARISAFMAFLRGLVQRDQAWFEGRGLDAKPPEDAG